MTILGRAKVDHPALGTTGGAGLHTSVETIYTVLSDHEAGRYIVATSIANSAVTVFDHNLGSNLSELTVQIFTGTFPTGVLVPNAKSSGWTIAETSGFAKTKLDITAPSSGGPHTFYVLITNVSDAKERAEALNGIQPTYIPAMVGQVRFDSTYGQRWIATGAGAATDWKRQLDSSFKAVVNSNVGYGTHTSIASALADSNVVDGDRILVETNTTLATGLVVTKKVHLIFKPGVKLNRGSVTTGISFNAGSSGAIIENCRFEGFTSSGDKPLNIATGVANVKVLFPVFEAAQDSEVTDVDGNSIVIGSITE